MSFPKSHGLSLIKSEPFIIKVVIYSAIIRALGSRKVIYRLLIVSYTWMQQESGRSSLLAAICRHKVTVLALTPSDRITPMGNGGTPRTGNASEAWQRLR